MNWHCVPVGDNNEQAEVSLLGKCSEELNSEDLQLVLTIAILVGLSEPDEAAFHLLGDGKRSDLRGQDPEILPVCLSIKLSPKLAIRRTLHNPRLKTPRPYCVVSRLRAFRGNPNKSIGLARPLTGSPDFQ